MRPMPNEHQPNAAMNEPNTPDSLYESSLHSLPLVHRGKVRDSYAVGSDKLLMIATDRISAFDVVMKQPIPGKGAILTRIALFWFDKLAHIMPNHLTGIDPVSVVAPDEVDQVRGRAMVVKRLTPVPIEAVVRGYLEGSAWKEYERTGTACGIALPAGLKKGDKLPAPIFTPATKAAAGEHDENIDFARMATIIGAERAAEIRDASIRLFNEASTIAASKGLTLVDTKFEFGLDGVGRLTLMDEVLTPDSSRFLAQSTEMETSKRSIKLDKQVLRDWLIETDTGSLSNGVHKIPSEITSSIQSKVYRAYTELADRLTI